MKDLIREIHVGYILHERKFQVAARAFIAIGTTALAGLILMQTNETPVPPTVPSYRAHTGPTFEIPRSDDGPNSTNFAKIISNQIPSTTTTVSATERTP